MTAKPHGAPIGNNNAAKNKPWRDALDHALANYECEGSKIEKNMALRAIGKKLIQLALDGDLQAIKEIGDRVDGKSTEHKVIDKTVTERFEGLSEAAAILRKFAGLPKDDASQGDVSH
jgi:ribosomal protein L17